MALSLLGSRALREALDVKREPRQVRERYGMTLFGQGALAARRLVEAGTEVRQPCSGTNTAWPAAAGTRTVTTTRG